MKNGQTHPGNGRPYSLFDGARYPFLALGLLGRTPRLWHNIWMPVLLNIVVGALLYAGLLAVGLRGVDGLVAASPEWLQPFGDVLRVVLIIGLLLAIGFVLVRFGVVLGAPWYSNLARQIEIMRLGPAVPDEPPGCAAAMSDLGRAIAYEIKKLLLVGGIGLLLLPLNLLPAIGSLLAGTGWLLLGVLLTCLDFFDPPLERRRLRFREKMRTVRRGLPASGGFGLVCLLLVNIPVLNLIFVPICMAAGTLFFCDRLWQPWGKEGSAL